MRYTQDPPNLILPTLATIKHIAVREGVGDLAEAELDFIWDLLAKTGGAQVIEFDEVAGQAEAMVNAMEEAQHICERNPSLNSADVTRWLEDNYHRMQHQLYEVLEQLDLNQIPGYNHPTKAVRVVRLLRQMQVALLLRVINIFTMTLLEMIEAGIEKVEALQESDLALLTSFVGDIDDAEDQAKMLGVELQLCGMNLDELLRIARHLNELSEFQSKRGTPISDPNGEEVKLRDIKDLSELGRASQQAFALPQRLRNQRAVSGELGIRQPETRRDQKQLLFLVIDGSGSMLFDDGAVSASRAAGVVMNRLNAVIDGDAEVYVRFFDSHLRKEEFHADNPASARKLMRTIMDPLQYMGNSTEFSTTLQAASQRIRELMSSGHLREPELVFVTDGAARVPPVSILDGIKMHVVQVGTEEVTQLSDLARQSGGIGLYTGISVDSM